jgi:hypothetical protein
MNHGATIKEQIVFCRVDCGKRRNDGEVPKLWWISELRARATGNASPVHMHLLRMDGYGPEIPERGAEVFPAGQDRQADRVAAAASGLRHILPAKRCGSAWNQRQLFQRISEDRFFSAGDLGMGKDCVQYVGATAVVGWKESSCLDARGPSMPFIDEQLTVHQRSADVHG